MRKIILVFIIGMLCGFLFYKIFTKSNEVPKYIAVINDQQVTENKLYETMKWSSGLEKLLDIVDTIILNQIYPTTKELQNEVNKHIEEQLLSNKTYYDYTEEELYHYLGYENKRAYYSSLLLHEKRLMLQYDFVEASLTEEEIVNYYDNKIFGDIVTNYIFIPFKYFSDEEEVEITFSEVINKLNSGILFEKIKEEYPSLEVVLNSTQTPSENLGDEVLKNLNSLTEGEYNKTPIITTEGYYIVQKIASKEKPSLAKIQENIKKELTNLKIASNPSSFNQALINMRKEYNFQLKDLEYNALYEEYLYKNSKLN